MFREEEISQGGRLMSAQSRSISGSDREAILFRVIAETIKMKACGKHTISLKSSQVVWV